MAGAAVGRGAHDLGVARALLQETSGGHYVLEIETSALADLRPARAAGQMRA